MQSHICEFKIPDLIRLLGRPLIAVAVFAVVMHTGARFGWLPAPRPTLDVDRTILVQKAEASRTLQDAEILLLGDSSCLMDVSATRLTGRLGRPVLNLGTLSYMDLSSNTLLMSNYVHANPGRLRAVVLLMHPEALRLPRADAWQNQAFHSFLEGTDFHPQERASDRVAGILGVHILQGRVLARTLPRPLPGSFGRRYGFTDDLEDYLKANRGSAIDPESRPAMGRVEYRLADRFRSASASFCEALPTGVRLFVAITPLPEKYAGPGYPARHRELLLQWSEWLRADAALTNLPAVLPDRLFAQKTHLNEAGQLRYTDSFARALEVHLPSMRPSGSH